MLEQARKRLSAGLAAAGVESSEIQREVDLIVEHVTGLTTAQQALKAKDLIADEQMDALLKVLGDREKRIPLQYCLGYASFMGMRLLIRPGVFIPRCDTETLVEVALSSLSGKVAPKVADLCTGSGAIAIAILKRHLGSQVTAIDVSSDAVSLALENAISQGVDDRLTLINEDWTVALPFELDAIISNPPYIPLSQKDSLAPEVAQHEPHLALFGQDPDGLAFYRALSQIGQEHLKEEGFLALEIGDYQAEQAREIFAETGWDAIDIHKDLNGLPRVLSCQKPN